MQITLDRFDWNRWLATIPGIPSDWGLPARPERSDRAPPRRRKVLSTRH